MAPVANSTRTKFQVSDRVATNSLAEMLRDALTGPNHRGAPEVVWDDRGSRVLLHVGRLQVRTLDAAAVVVAVGVETAEFGESQLIVRFVFGQGRDPSTFVTSSDEMVHGHPMVAARWGTLYRNVIWAALKRMVETHADERGMRPGRITVGKDQIRLTAQPPLPLPLAELAALHRQRLSAVGERPTDDRAKGTATGGGR